MLMGTTSSKLFNFLAECVVMFPCPGLWDEGRSSEHPSSRQLCTPYIACGSHERSYHGQGSDQPRCGKFMFKSAKSGVEISGARRVSEHATMFCLFLTLPPVDAKSVVR